MPWLRNICLPSWIASYQFLTWVPSHQKNCRKGYNTRTQPFPFISALPRIPKVGTHSSLGPLRGMNHMGHSTTEEGEETLGQQRRALGSVGSTQIWGSWVATLTIKQQVGRYQRSGLPKGWGQKQGNPTLSLGHNHIFFIEWFTNNFLLSVRA